MKEVLQVNILIDHLSVREDRSFEVVKATAKSANKVQLLIVKSKNLNRACHQLYSRLPVNEVPDNFMKFK